MCIEFLFSKNQVILDYESQFTFITIAFFKLIFHSSFSDQKLFVSPYRQLLVHLDIKLEDDNLKAMKFLLADVIPDGTRESVTTALEFFETLEHHGKLSAEDVSELKMLLENIPRKDLMGMLNRFDSVRSKPKG